MANEAKIVNLGSTVGDVYDFTCANADSFTKGQILWFSDPRTVSGASIYPAGAAFAGIAVADKESNDGATQVGCYTKGIFDLTLTGDNVVCGQTIFISGQNLVAGGAVETISGGMIVGTSLEDAGNGEVFEVMIG